MATITFATAKSMPTGITNSVAEPVPSGVVGISWRAQAGPMPSTSQSIMAYLQQSADGGVTWQNLSSFGGPGGTTGGTKGAPSSPVYIDATENTPLVAGTLVRVQTVVVAGPITVTVSGSTY